MPTKNDLLIKALRKIDKQFYDIERNHWEESANPEDHIFHDFNTIHNYLHFLDHRPIDSVKVGDLVKNGFDLKKTINSISASTKAEMNHRAIIQEDLRRMNDNGLTDEEEHKMEDNDE